MSKRTSSEIDHYIGRRIKAERLLARMTLTTLAERIGVTYQQVQKYETGRNRVSAANLLSIAETLSLPVAALYPPAEHTIVDRASLGRAMLDDALRPFDKLEPPTQRLAITMVGHLFNSLKDGSAAQ